ncbi:DUF2085 domain-containing protein [endosymbiont 'TC1' of Trimyema compressum]|uniref:DUF2085 domain-containing protein n=1 Tax=endosymbiont 'TC1' of Trimyema compressum TaxID=243899 RepID=UPI000AFE3246|nr:DUF2085 domain-containing protein [endosymbiont 'TC1' of Trimyema compressum]
MDGFWQKNRLPSETRSKFFINGYQFPVCARCTGVIISYILAIPLVMLIPIKPIIALIGCSIMLFDFGYYNFLRYFAFNK